MPIATYVEGTYKAGPTHFMAPKRSDLRGWWNAVRRAMPRAGLGYYSGQKAEVTGGSIIFELGPDSRLIIDRRGSGI